MCYIIHASTAQQVARKTGKENKHYVTFLQLLSYVLYNTRLNGTASVQENWKRKQALCYVSPIILDLVFIVYVFQDKGMVRIHRSP